MGDFKDWRRGGRAVMKRVRARAADEQGQSLVLVALAMVAVIGMAALAIDASTWYQKHHQAQVAADSAALAFANCMANADSTGNQCTSSTDTTNATTQAITFAGDNGVTITSSNVSPNTTNKTVTVTAPDPAPSFFAKLFGVTSTPTSTATASWLPPTSGACTTPGNSCYAIFAMNSSCTVGSSESSGSPLVLNGSSDTIDGGVHSNGSIDLVGGSQILGLTTYGNGSGCQTKQGGSGDLFTSGPTAEAPDTDLAG